MKLLTDIVRSFFVQVRIWPPRKKRPRKKELLSEIDRSSFGFFQAFPVSSGGITAVKEIQQQYLQNCKVFPNQISAGSGQEMGKKVY
jgi:hypothetical protein